MTVGQNIRALRKKKGLTQAQLGKLCGITGPMLSGYERGETLPKKKALESIAKALEVPASRLTELPGRGRTSVVQTESSRLLLEGILEVLKAEYGCAERKTVGNGDASESYYLIGFPPKRFVLYEKDLRAMAEAARASAVPQAESVRRRQAWELQKLG